MTDASDDAGGGISANRMPASRRNRTDPSRSATTMRAITLCAPAGLVTAITALSEAVEDGRRLARAIGELPSAG